VFSPYYAWARRRGTPDPLAHSAVNVALYSRSRHRWAMTERGPQALARDSSSLSIGPSVLEWRNDALTVHLDEVTAPWPTRIRGHVRLHPAAFGDAVLGLDAAGRHVWRAFAPLATVEVVLDAPRLRWRGKGYLDGNSGAEPLDAAFERWDWSRATGRRHACVLYDVVRRGGEPAAWALRFDAHGRAEAREPPPRVTLPRSAWGIRRGTRVAGGGEVRVVATLEDGPFYARTRLSTRVGGEAMDAIHETVSLERFRRGWVRCLLPFRMPRRGRGSAGVVARVAPPAVEAQGDELDDRPAEHEREHDEELDQAHPARVHGRR